MFLTNKCDQSQKTCLEFWKVNYRWSQWTGDRWSDALIRQETLAALHYRQNWGRGGGHGGNVENVVTEDVVTRLVVVEVVWRWPQVVTGEGNGDRWQWHSIITTSLILTHILCVGGDLTIVSVPGFLIKPSLSPIKEILLQVIQFFRTVGSPDKKCIGLYP